MDEPQPLVIQKFGRGGYYDKPKELLEQIVPYLRNYDPTANASYNNVTKCIDFKGSGQYKICVYAPLAFMLGLKDGEWWTLSHHSAPYPCNLKIGMYNLFVYTDIIQYQQVGHSHATLLSVVTVKGDFGDVVSIRHNMIHYLRLSKNRIKSIHIEIKMDRNRCVDFVYGKSIVKLHFRLATPL
ncbi:hypothetical protein LDENG_00208080 [Lucifuga dentata]|nr:hypothetical protein LDENG_00208080 [Lucifuga dentata]